MFIQKENRAIRKGENLSFDIEYLKRYYSENGKNMLFNQVLIETRTDCNKKCSFCPQTKTSKNVGKMKMVIFKKIIDQLAEIKYAGRLALYLSNEPLLESRLFDMIRYARKKSSSFFIDISTNGVLLSEKKLEKLFSIGLDNIIVNDYRSDRIQNPKRISKNLKELIEQYRYNPKVTYNPRSSKEILSNYAGSAISSSNQEELGFCNFPFRKLTISYKGDVLLCCNDFIYETNFGNIINDNIKNIWYSDEMNRYRIALLAEKRIGLCAKCNQVQEYKIY